MRMTGGRESDSGNAHGDIKWMWVVKNTFLEVEEETDAMWETRSAPDRFEFAA